MEDYKEKYEQALEWAKQVKDGKIGVAIDDLVEKFPELKESEDEKIRKELIKLMKQMSNTIVENYTTIEISTFVSWLEKQGDKHAEPVTVVERDGEQWVRVCALGEDFIIAAHDYREGDKTEFTWEEACKIGTFSKRQGYIMLALKDEINARLEEIGGEPLASYYWSSSEYYQNFAWYVYFLSDSVSTNSKYYSYVARAVAAF